MIGGHKDWGVTFCWKLGLFSGTLLLMPENLKRCITRINKGKKS